MNTKPLLIAAVSAAVLAAGYTMMPQTGEKIAPDTSITKMSETTVPVEMTPEASIQAPVEAAPEAPAEAPQETAAMVVNPDGESATARSPIVTYGSKEECAASTGRECHEAKCENVPEGQSAADVCGPEFVEGWQAIVPTPDNAAIPEIVAPAMEVTPDPVPAP